MRMVMRPRYYCEACGRGSGSPSAMKHHEVRCTANPARVCGFCARLELEQAPIGTLVEALGTGDAAGVQRLRHEAHGCPACMLAAIRQSRLQRPTVWDHYGNLIDSGFHVEFDFKNEKRICLEAHNCERYGVKEAQGGN